MNYHKIKEYKTKIRLDLFWSENTVNDVKTIICEKIVKKCFLSWLRFIKKHFSFFFSGKISRCFIYPSLNSSDRKLQNNVCFKIIGTHRTLTPTFAIIVITGCMSNVVDWAAVYTMWSILDPELAWIHLLQMMKKKKLSLIMFIMRLLISSAILVTGQVQVEAPKQAQYPCKIRLQKN